ncbi:hypothetical protein BZG36_00292 [Bifiguratus adelaidae]|uniref:ABC1 atypical kinase-like domain-containing protein n=1 Tax=Bifiguratus adelaidae TaxID=1938954 RepID=A0A261Y848_9FUNG|nr:hypothetical protein BZG36_00292 [Bifiguratus adelaidae]
MVKAPLKPPPTRGFLSGGIIFRAVAVTTGPAVAGANHGNFFSKHSSQAVQRIENNGKHTFTPNEVQENRLEEKPLVIRICLRIWSMIDRYILEPLFTLRRFLHLLALFAPVAITAPATCFGRRKPDHDNERTGSLWWYRFLVRQMERAGPTFIKLAQWAASRTDIFPNELCHLLSKLHSQVDPHPFKATRRTIEHAFGGRRLEDIFEDLEEQPLGIGAIAQVYKAKLRPDIVLEHFEDLMYDVADRVPTVDSVTVSMPANAHPRDIVAHPRQDQLHLHTTVAIKILHPRVHVIVLRDLKIMKFFAKCLDLIPTVHWLSLPEEVEKFGEMMEDQLDLRIEASNLKQFQRNFENRRTAKFPRPLMQYTTRDMLMEEFIEGVPLKVFLDAARVYGGKRAYDEGKEFDTRIADIGLDSFLHMLIFDNFIHADLHPGNIMIKFYKPGTYNKFRQYLQQMINRPLVDDGTIAVRRLRAVKDDPEAMALELSKLHHEGYQAQLIFIDAGLVTTLNAVNRNNFLELFRALAEFDGYRAGELMVDRCRRPDQVINKEIFALKMQKLILDIKQRTFQLGNVKIEGLLHSVMQMVREHHVKLEGDFVNVVISILLLEGIGRQLNPDLDLFKSALPILRDLGTRDAGRAAIEGVKDIRGSGGAWIKVWVLLEARKWATIQRRETDWENML